MQARRGKWIKVVVAVWFSLAAGPLFGQQLLADLSPELRSGSRDPGLMAAVGSGLVMAANSAGDRELWFTAGTPESTRLVRDLLPGRNSSSPEFLGVLRGRAMVFAGSGQGNVGLWATDGTTEGTEPFPRFAFWRRDQAAASLVVGENLYIVAAPGLWITDGTVAGLHPLPGLSIQLGGVLPQFLTAVEDRVFFRADDGQSGFQLWVADGTGVRQLTQLEGSTFTRSISGMTPVGDRLFFAGCESVTGCEPWISDGTANGTRRIVDLVPGTVGSMGGFVFSRPGLAAGDSVIFIADNGSGSAAWLSDGTVAGTVSIVAGATSLSGREVAHGTLFVPDSFTTAGDLWVSDGSALGTVALVANAASGSVATGIRILAHDSDQALLMIDDGVHGSEPWISDGSAGGTRLLADLCAGECGSVAGARARVLGGEFYFAIRSAGVLDQLWRTDGTPRNTQLVTEDLQGNTLVQDLRTTATGTKLVLTTGPLFVELWSFDDEGLQDRLLGKVVGSFSSNPRGGWELASGIAFLADEYRSIINGFPQRTRVAISDGSAEGTGWVEGFAEEFDARYAVALPSGLVVVGEDRGSRTVAAIYVTDGTSEGTRLVRQDFSPHLPSCGLFRLGEQALFFTRAVGGSDLWRTDGTAAGTALVAERVGTFSCGLSEPAVLAGRLYFFDNDNNLWRSDGSTAGTKLIFDLPNDASFLAGQMAVAGNFLYFEEVRGGGSILWRSDGTLAGTIELAPLSESGLSSFWYFVALGDQLMFRAYRNDTGLEPWISDGTPAGTRMVRDISPGNRGSSPLQFHEYRGKVYFAADDGQDGAEFWVSDGTTAGTQLVRDISPGSASSRPLGFATVGETLYFAASDGPAGSELWASDGTAVGSRRLIDLAPGPASSEATVFASIGDRLLLSANDGTSGFEPWVLDLGELLPDRCTTGGEDLCLHDGRFRVQVSWRNQRNGEVGKGGAVPFSDRSGFFWFFDESNIELVVKVLDGSSINGFYWTFYGALSDVEYTIDVIDLETGRSKSYRNPPGEICGMSDTTSISAGALSSAVGSQLSMSAVLAMPSEAVASATPLALSPPAPAGSCAPSSTTLCLLDGRFAVEVDWHNTSNGESDHAGAIVGTNKSGYFWFFNPANVELVVKMLDGRVVNDHFWLFFGALSHVEYSVRVTDTVTRWTRTYDNPQGEICGQADILAFTDSVPF